LCREPHFVGHLLAFGQARGLAGRDDVYLVTSLACEEIAAAVRQVETTLTRLHEAGIRTVVASEFLAGWREQAGLPAAEPRPRTMAVEIRRLCECIGDVAERIQTIR
jgi:hypothetical protein